MKNLFVLFICLCISTLSIAQNNCINTFVEKYKGLTEASHLTIGGNLLSFMSHDEDSDESFRTSLNSLEVLTVDEFDIQAKDIQALRQGIQANNYEELIRVRDGKDLIHVFLTEKNPGIINKLIVMIEGTETFTLLSLSGEIHYDDLSQMNFDGDAGDALGKLPARTKERP